MLRGIKWTIFFLQHVEDPNHNISINKLISFAFRDTAIRNTQKCCGYCRSNIGVREVICGQFWWLIIVSTIYISIELKLKLWYLRSILPTAIEIVEIKKNICRRKLGYFQKYHLIAILTLKKIEYEYTHRFPLFPVTSRC